MSLSLIERDLKTMAKTLKPNLDKDELNTLYKANLAYAKNTHEHFFKTKKDLDYKIFNPSIMHEQSFISFVGGQGAKRLLDMLYKLAFNAKSNKIALDRHYAKTFLQIVARTLRKNVNILEEQGLIEVIKNKQRYLYVYLKDYRELEGYNSVGANKKSNIPSPFFLQIMRFLEKFAKAIEKVTINKKECIMHIPSQELMQRANNMVLKFTPISNPNTTYTLTYKDLTNKDIPSNLCFYQTAIVKKNLLKALKDRECVGEPISNSPKVSNYFQESA
ncbi:integrase [Helicobacter pylori]|nr:integrase [Helicobacter pylori]